MIESERELKIKAKDLEELNAALNVLLNKRQEDKEELEEGILSNVRTLIEPYIVKLKRSKLP
ncbi:MAG: spore gernimation protein GerE, partial [Deltaproteobacteria bacterium]|nr:spore gernimation protein GerE [Deltaproteobacteria bacterium]